MRYALARPFDDDPGGRMLYSTGSSHLMSAVLTRASGRSTYDLATEWLARPLGIAIPQWPRDGQGVYFGGNDMLLTPLQMVAFGELYLNDGRAGGLQIIPSRLKVKTSATTTTATTANLYAKRQVVARTSGRAIAMDAPSAIEWPKAPSTLSTPPRS